MSDECTGPCFVCGRRWLRSEVDLWLYFSGILVCRCHPGAEEWYAGALKMADEKLRIITEAP